MSIIERRRRCPARGTRGWVDDAIVSFLSKNVDLRGSLAYKRRLARWVLVFDIVRMRRDAQAAALIGVVCLRIEVMECQFRPMRLSYDAGVIGLVGCLGLSGFWAVDWAEAKLRV